MNDTHEVSVKAAIYSSDTTAVLVMYFPKRDIFSLPGGHIDAGENPDQALAREFNEELGIAIPSVVHADFFSHGSGKIILGYMGYAPLTLQMAPSNPGFEYGIWKTKNEFDELDELRMDTGYKQFVLRNWPITTV